MAFLIGKEVPSLNLQTGSNGAMLTNSNILFCLALLAGCDLDGFYSQQGQFAPEQTTTISSSKSDGSAGTEVTVPDGALPSGTSLQIEEGNEVVSQAAIEALGIEGGVESVGSPINVGASQDIPDAVASKLEISVPYDERASLWLAATHVVVMYHVKREDGKFYFGVIPTSKLTIKDGFLKFKAVGLGNYQIAKVEVEIKEEKKAQVDVGIFTKEQVQTKIKPTETSVAINNGAQYTNSKNVTLQLSAKDAVEVYITNKAQCISEGSWSALGSSDSWTLAQENEEAHVFVKFRSADGLESDCSSDSIAHDGAAPSVSITDDGSTMTSTSESPTITWTGSDSGSGIAEYYFAIGSSAGSDDVYAWTAVGSATSKKVSSLSLSAGNSYYPSVKAVDHAGNVSSVITGDGWSVSSNNANTVGGYTQQAYTKPVNSVGSPMYYGQIVSIDGDTVVVGAYQEASISSTITNGTMAPSSSGLSGSGAVYVYRRSGTSWQQEAHIKADNAGGSDFFGQQVDISGDTLVVSAPNEASNQSSISNASPSSIDNSVSYSGAVYVYKRTGSTWTHESYIKAANSTANLYFGRALAIDQDTLVVGSEVESSNQTTITNGSFASYDTSVSQSGAVYVYKRTGAGGAWWEQEAYIKAANADASDFFGISVDVHGDSVVVGAKGEGSNQTTITNGSTASLDNSLDSSGAAYVYVRTGTSWSQQAYLKPPFSNATDYFGYSVAIYGDTIAVGSTNEDSSQTTITNGTSIVDDNNTTDAGAVYIYKRSGTQWQLESYIKAANASSAAFADNLSLYGNDLVVGSPYEASDQTTITNGTTASSSNAASAAGAAYVFTRSGSSWQQKSYVKASNVDAGDRFGSAVAISNGEVVVGAPQEDSSQTTITNGESASADNGAPNVGAVYIYTSGSAN